MAATIDDDESWLYGDPNNEEIDPVPGDEAPFEDQSAADIDDSHDEIIVKPEEAETEERDEVDGDGDKEDTGFDDIQESSIAARKVDDREAGELSGGEDEGGGVLVVEDGSGDTDSDDDVQVTIGDIKTSPSYSYGSTPVNLNIKRGGAYASGTTQGGGTKGKGIDLDAVGMINGVPAYEFNLDSLEEKPWRKPGADITDYFNYGFNEETWKIYCEKQRKLRGEGPVVTTNKPVSHLLVKDQQIPVASLNDNSKYSAGPPPGRKFSGAIDVIGGTSSTSRRPVLTPPKENVIQVMTGDKRDFGRKPFMEGGMLPSGGGPPPHMPPSGFIPPDLSIPPPVMAPPIPGMPPPGMPPPGMPLPPPPAGIPPGYGDPYGGYPRYPVPPMSAISGPSDRAQAPGYEPRPPYYGPSNPNSFNHYDAPAGENQWDARDRPDSTFPPSWDFPRERSSELSPTRSPAASHEDENERKHSERHRDKDRDRNRDKDRDRDREREKSRDRERDRDREYDYEERRSRDKDRERRHRDRDRDKEHRSSRRKHRDDDDSEHRSSRHKRKRSKRDKDDDGDTRDSGSLSENPVPPITIKEEKKD
ncbi:hypothetical protein CHUAL_004486 [Chamberlinius hualienensis]